MHVTWLDAGWTLLQFTLYGLLLFYSMRNRPRSAQAPFYSLTIWWLVTDAGRWAAIWEDGLCSRFYSSFYHFAIVGSLILQARLLTQLYALVRSRRPRLCWKLVAGLTISTLLVSLHASTEPIPSFQIFHISAAAFLSMFCLLNALQARWNPRVFLRRNHRGLLWGLFWQALSGGLLMSSFVLGRIEYEAVRPWIQPICLVPWIIWVFTMRTIRPARVISERAATKLDSLDGSTRKRIERELRR